MMLLAEVVCVCLVGGCLDVDLRLGNWPSRY